jgi:hypothetical protein
MTTVDRRGCAITGATPAALDSYERALAAWQAWRRDDDTALQGARREAPGFVMAHAFTAWQLATTRDVRRVAAARPIVAGALRLPANERERMHLAALSAVLDDDFEGAKARLGRLLDRWPRDAIALGVAHSLDHVTGDVARMRRRVERAMPAWSRNDPAITRCSRCTRSPSRSRVPTRAPRRRRTPRSSSIRSTRAPATRWRTSSR